MYRSLTVQSFALSIVLITALIFMGCDDSIVDPDPDPDPDEGITLTGEVVAPQGDAAAAAEQTNADRSSQENNDHQVADDELDVREATPSDEQNLESDVQSAVLDGETPVADATVEIFDLVEYTQNPATADPVATATTDEDGQYEADNVPEDIDLLILVDTEPRLASITYEVNESASGDVSTATTLAAERWGPELLDGSSVSEDDLEETIAVARELLDEKESAEIAEILEALVTDSFGNGFPEDLSPDYQTIVNALEGIEAAVCEDLELDETSARPTNVVQIYGLDEAFGEEPIAWLYDATSSEPDEEDRHPVVLERSNGGTDGTLNIPLHPENYMEGGSAEVVVVSEEEDFTCPGLDFTIEAMEPAPGTLEGIVDEMEAALKERAEALDVDPAELVGADAAELTPDLLPIAVGLQAIKGPDYPNNLRAILAGEAPVAQEHPLEGEHLEALEAAVYASGFADDMIATAQEMADLPEIPAIFQEGMEDEAGTLSAKALTLERVSVDDPQTLDRYMDAQARCANANSGAAAASRLAGGLAITTAAFLLPGGQSAAALAGLNLFLMELTLDICEEQFPSRLDEIELDLTRQSYIEEEDEPGEWTAELEAESDGFSLNWPDALGAVPGMGEAGTLAGRLAGQSGDILRLTGDTTELLQGFITASLGLTEEGFINWPPSIFGPVDVDPTDSDADEYFRWELVNHESHEVDEPFVLVQADTMFQPTGVGTSELWVQTIGSAFQDEHSSAQEILEVEAIEVEIEEYPTGERIVAYEIDPGEEIELWANVSNADNLEVEWYIEVEDGPDPASIETSGTYNQHATFVAPEEDASYTLYAESFTEEGLREGREPPRDDNVLILVGDQALDQDLEITPVTGCLTVDESHPFSATLDGMDISFSELDWTIGGSGDGTLGNDGVFTPTSTGEVDIEIWPQGDTDAAVELSFLIQDNCGEMVVDITLNEDGSAPVEYQHESTCVAGRAFTDPSGETASVFLTRKAPLGGVGGLAKVELNMFSFDISDGDEWTASAEGAMSIRNIDEDEIWAIPFVEFSVVKEQLTIQTNGGEEVIPVFSGSWPEHTMDVDDGTVTVAGEFSNVRYGEDGCGPLSHPAWDEIIDGL